MYDACHCAYSASLLCILGCRAGVGEGLDLDHVVDAHPSHLPKVLVLVYVRGHHHAVATHHREDHHRPVTSMLMYEDNHASPQALITRCGLTSPSITLDLCRRCYLDRGSRSQQRDTPHISSAMRNHCRLNATQKLWAIMEIWLSGSMSFLPASLINTGLTAVPLDDLDPATTDRAASMV